MYHLSQLIETLSDQEKRKFIRFLGKRNKREDVKNIELFKQLEEGKEDVKLKTTIGSGAYHALRKRLLDTLLDFIAVHSFETETSEEYEILKLLLTSRILLEQKHYTLGLNILSKAERQAKDLDLFNILNEIYYTKIQFAHQNSKIDLSSILLDYQSNKANLEQEENLNIFYAIIQREFSDTTTDLLSIIDKAFSLSNIHIESNISIRSSYKLIETLNKIGHHSRKYYQLLPLFEKLFIKIKTKNKYDSKNLFYFIQILYYMTNAYFRVRKFSEAHSYLHLMHEKMIEQQNKFYKRFTPQFTLLQALLYNYTGEASSAIALLEQFDYNTYKNQFTQLLDLRLTLALLHFQQNNLKNTSGILNEFTHTDTWYVEKTGITWTLKKNILEILLFFEKNEIDLFDSRFKSFKKRYLSYLKANKEKRVLQFVQILNDISKNRDILNDHHYLEKIESSLTNLPSVEEDIFEMSIYAWLKSKINNTDLYSTTLVLMNSN